VTIPLRSSNVFEGTVSPSSLTFTPASWNVAQTVTVTGVDDLVADGPQTYTILTDPALSLDPVYSGTDAPDVAVTNLDNDVAGIAVTPTSGLVTSEAGGTASFTMVLTSKPTANVTVPLRSSNLAEGTVSPASVTFTPSDWNVVQTVTITGVNDFVVDGPQPYTIITDPAVSLDPVYAGTDAPDVSVTNLDNDVAGIFVTPTSGLVTSEAGGAATFTIALGSQPVADVTVSLTSTNVAEGIVSPASVTFSPATWSVPQVVVVTGVDDFVVDGDQLYTIATGAAVSTDGVYAGLKPADVSVTNLDNDVAGVAVNPTSGLVTTGAGGTASFTVVLTSQPVADVTIPLSSSNPAEGTVSPASLTFTAASWNVAQTVTVTGVDDFVVNGPQPYTVVTGPAVSADPHYGGLDPADVSVTNLDNDVAGIAVIPTSGLVTTEAGGTATFTVVLTSKPTADVTIPLRSSMPTEGTVSPASLTFTSATWNVPQTVTVTGVDDHVADGPQTYTIFTDPAQSLDPVYSGTDAPDVAVTNLDNDVAGIAVTPTSGLVTSEAGGTATFTIVLTSQPTADVTIPLHSSNVNEGTVSPASVTFTAATWNLAQAVTVTGVNDFVVDGPQAYTIVTDPAVSQDPAYAGTDAPDVSVTNLDNDVAGIFVTPTSGLVTSEAGGAATFSIVLASQPTADVTISLTSSNTGEGTVSPASVTFTSADWLVPQVVVVTGVDDFVVDGDQLYTIATGAAVSTDGVYAGLKPADVSVTNLDNDVAGVAVNPTSGLVTTQSGGTATFTVVLTSQPHADVTVPLASSNPAVGTVSPDSVTFTPATWNAAQTVTVTGVNDGSVDPVAYSVLTGPAVAADPVADAAYQGLDPADVSVTNAP
jgi:threonine aldolase